jgi:hypothetical protein
MAKAKKKVTHKCIVYYPPSQSTIDTFARDVCIYMGQKVDLAYNTPEMIRGFSSFIKIVASIYAKHLTKFPDTNGKFDI